MCRSPGTRPWEARTYQLTWHGHCIRHCRSGYAAAHGRVYMGYMKTLHHFTKGTQPSLNLTSAAGPWTDTPETLSLYAKCPVRNFSRWGWGTGGSVARVPAWHSWSPEFYPQDCIKCCLPVLPMPGSRGKRIGNSRASYSIVRLRSAWATWALYQSKNK